MLYPLCVYFCFVVSGLDKRSFMFLFMMIVGLKVFTLNVRGLRDGMKRKACLLPFRVFLLMYSLYKNVI